jgi:hypothetical protein
VTEFVITGAGGVNKEMYAVTSVPAAGNQLERNDPVDFLT